MQHVKIGCTCTTISLSHTQSDNRSISINHGNSAPKISYKVIQLQQVKPVFLFLLPGSYFKTELHNCESLLFLAVKCTYYTLMLAVFRGQNYPRYVDKSASKLSRLLVGYLKISKSLVG